MRLSAVGLVDGISRIKYAVVTRPFVPRPRHLPGSSGFGKAIESWAAFVDVLHRLARTGLADRAVELVSLSRSTGKRPRILFEDGSLTGAEPGGVPIPERRAFRCSPQKRDGIGLSIHSVFKHRPAALAIN